MPPGRLLIVFVLLSALGGAAAGAGDGESPPGDKEPVLQIDPGGPAAFVTALAFGPDGKTLYAGGWDKVVRAWSLNARGTFESNRSAYRVPIGPGLNGAINAIALSPDGAWLAVAGNGMAREVAGFRDLGFIVPAPGARTPLMLRDTGTIYLFNTQDRTIRLLRGHRGHVTALTFGPPRGKATPLLLSAAEEEKENTVETELTARLWDPDRGESVAVSPGLPSKALGGRRPGAALWQSGENGGEVRAALALHDGNLHVWDATEAQAKPRRMADLLYNLGVVHLGRGRLLTAGADPESKRPKLSLWRVPAEGQPERLRVAGLGDGFIRALAALSRQGDGTADTAAVIALLPGQQGAPHQYRLRIIDLRPEKFGTILADHLLWKDQAARQPVVVASLRGEHLAVAGDPDHTIRVFPIRSLLAREEVAPQILRGDVLTFRHASFVRRGNTRGLLLNGKIRKGPGAAPPQPDRARGDWIFDFARGRLTDVLDGWQADRPEVGGWRAVYDGGRSIAIQDGEDLVRKVPLPDREELNDFALLPPGEKVKVPLLALATHRNGQPTLALYNAKSAEKLREYTGHKERLRSLAFTADGRLLVSAAEDGTVCVWSLTDLATVLGRRGRLVGVRVGGSRGAVKVREVEADSPARAKLRPEDVVAGVVEKDKLRRTDSPRAFYEAMDRLRPGSQVVLRRGDPDGNDDVTLDVGQGIDERKPLFSLFVSRADKAADCEWIGWSPIGPYDASSPRAEKYLGWHFNTGDPKAPTRFADAGQYRKFYSRPGLLERLIVRGDSGRVESLQLPPPVVGLWVEEGGQIQTRAGEEVVIVRRPRIDLKAALRERPLSSLSSLAWQLDDGRETPFPLDQPGEPIFQIPATLARGEHRFVVTARTRDLSPQPTRETLLVSYQPLPPKVMHADAGRQLRVREAKYVLQADLLSGATGEDVNVTVHHRHAEGQKKPYTHTFAGRESAGDKPLRLERELKLFPGDNEVEIVAVNGGAPDGGRQRETARVKLAIFYYFRAKPPTIAFRRAVPVTERGEGEPLVVDPSRPLVVRLPEMKLVGMIQAGEEPLQEVMWDRGPSTEATRLDRFEPGKHDEFAFEQTISLSREKGLQTIRLRARTKNSEEIQRSIILQYQPPVPVVTSLTEPRPGTTLDGKGEAQVIPVRARVMLPEGATDYRVVILVNGKASPRPAVLDEKAGTLIGEAVVGPGDNRIQVQLSNRWGASGTSETVVVRYVRPPVIASLKHEPVPQRARVNLTAEVFSPSSLLRDTVRVEVNGAEATPGDVRITAGEKDHWTVRLTDVPLDAGSREQKILLRLGNAEAECRSPADLSLQSAMVLPPPVVEFLDPREDGAISAAFTTVRFQVRSESKLERVRLLRGGRVVPVELPPARQERGRYELTATAEIELEPGPNRLRVEAIGVGGRLPDAPQRVLTYVPPPLRVEVERLTEQRAQGPSLPPSGRSRGILVFPESLSGRVWLHGHVAWADSGEGWRSDSFLLRVFVNGFQQLPFEVQRKPNEKETPFRVQLLLNRRKGNRITLLASRQEAGSPVESLVDCARPIAAQRLHVLALGPHSSPDVLRERILTAINAHRGKEGARPSAFQDVDVLPPLTGSRFSPHHLCCRLAELKDAIRSRQRAGGSEGLSMSDVLMIYYEGSERIDDKGHFFESFAPPGADIFGMSCDKLVSYLSDVPGAHVLLLDVERAARSVGEDHPRDHIERWGDDYPDARAHVVVMRCARRGEPGRPGQVRLMPVLRKHMPQADRLSKLVALIEEAIAESEERNLLVFTKYLPTELADLMVGPPP